MKQFSELEYTRPDFEAFSREFESHLGNLSSAESVAKAVEIMGSINAMRRHLDTMLSIAHVRHTIDTKDEFYEQEREFSDDMGPKYGLLVWEYYKVLIASKFRTELEAKYGTQLFKLAEMGVKAFSPEVVEDLQKENQLASEYTKLLAGAKIQFDGKELNLAGMAPYSNSIDRSVREAASNVKWGFFAENQETLDSLFDQLVKLRHSIALKLGFKNFVELGYCRMVRTDYNAEMVAKFREKILTQIVPYTQELRARQKSRLGIDKLMMFDEPLQFIDGNPTPKGTPEWIVENAKTMYNEMSEETKEFFNFMLDNGLMDLVNKPGKAGGGYCTNFSEYGAPFIFSNFNGTAHDVDVLTHEAGHAFQSYMSRNFEIPEYYFPTYEACEIHSMSMEFLAWPWMSSFFGKDEDKYQFQHLSGGLLFLPYGVAVDEFQHFVYENPHCTPTERNQAWLAVEKKYLPHRNHSAGYTANGGSWQQQAHIYRTPFYYIDYTLAQICAFQFWVKAKNNRPNAWTDYLALCKLGGSKSFVELVSDANLISPFADGVFDSINSDIMSRLNGIPDSNFSNN